MQSFVAAPALTYDGHEYLVGDVVLEAVRSGLWRWLETQSRVGCAARRACDAGADAIDRDALRTAGQMFRQARGLFSGEDLRAWLAVRGLTADDWIAWLERSLLAGRYAGESEALGERHAPSDEDVAAVLRADALCYGVLRTAADALLAHAAAFRAAGDGGDPADERDATAHEASALADPMLGLDTLPPPDVGTRLRHLAHLEAAAERFTQDLVNGEALERVLLAHRMEWAVLGWQELTFPGEGAAREVAMLVRQDGMTLGDVAEMLSVELTPRAVSLDAVEPDLAPLLTAAAAGDLLGPIETETGWKVLSIRERTVPSRTDATAFGRALEEVRSREIERQLAGRVRWHVEL